MNIVKTRTQKSLTNLQLELLKMFSTDVPENDLKTIRNILTKFFAEKAMDGAEAARKKKGWTKKDIEQLAKVHSRTKYR